MNILLRYSFTLSDFLQVIPPGMDFSNVVVQAERAEADTDLASIISADGASPKSVPPIWADVSYLWKQTCIIFKFIYF